MDYDEIVNNVNKYHYYVTTQSKIIHLSSSNSKNEAKNLALEKLQPNIDNLIGKKILFIKIKSVNDEYLKSKSSDELQVIGGPILIKFESGIIINSKKIKLGSNLFVIKNAIAFIKWFPYYTNCFIMLLPKKG